MIESDYYSIMEKRIKLLAKKYDPYNKYPVVWEKKREEEVFDVSREEAPKTTRVSTKVAKVVNAVTAFSF